MIVVGTPGRHKQSDPIIRKESERERGKTEMKVNREERPSAEHPPQPMSMYHQKYFFWKTKVRARSVCRYMPSTSNQK